jgi:hypothetical protein
MLEQEEDNAAHRSHYETEVTLLKAALGRPSVRLSIQEEPAYDRAAGVRAEGRGSLRVRLGDGPFVLANTGKIEATNITMPNIVIPVSPHYIKREEENAFCERLIGIIRRDCLDYIIPFNERHLKFVLNEFVAHYIRGRPHSALGLGIPRPSQAKAPASSHRHQLPPNSHVESRAVLGGLHHEFSLEKDAA